MPPLRGSQGDGTTAFSTARFNIIEECNWAVSAIFLDGVDMILRDDIANLYALFDKTKAVQVVKHSYKTKHPRKFVGTAMEADNHDYDRKNWSSAFILNCGHPKHWEARGRIRQAIANGDGKFLHRFAWLPDELIGELPIEWNWLPDEYGENEAAKLLHWTAGAPFLPHYKSAPMARHWHGAASRMRAAR